MLSIARLLSRFIPCSSLFCLFVVTANCHAMNLTEAELKFLQNRGPVVFVSQTQYPPFERTAKPGSSPEGMMIDVVRWMALELGFKAQFVDMPFQQAQQAVLSGKADIITSLFLSDKRQEQFSFSLPLFEVPASIFVRTERTDIKDIDDLHGKTIAIQRGDYGMDFLQSQRITFTLSDTANFAEAADQVIAGKADAIIGDEQIVLYHIFSNNLTDQIKKMHTPLYIGQNCMAGRRDDALLIDILNKGIRRAEKSGVLENISKKWLGTQYRQQKTFYERNRDSILMAVGVLACASLAVFLWNFQLRAQVRQKIQVIASREEQLRESERNFRTFFETIDDLVFVVRTDGNLIIANPVVSQKLGFSSEQLQSMHLLDLHSANDRKEAEEILAAMINRTLDMCPLPLQTITGKLLPVETRIWFGNWDGVDCIFGVSKDLTIEQEASQKFNKIFNDNPALMAVSILPERRFTDVNLAFLNILGFSRDEVLGRTAMELGLFVNPNEQNQIADQLKVEGKVINTEVQIKCKDGTLLDGLFSGDIIESQGKQYALTVFIDQTRQKCIDRALEASEKRFRRLFESLMDVYFRVDARGRICLVSPSVTNILGYHPEELLGRAVKDLYLRPEERLQILEYLDRGSIHDYELQMLRKDGSPIWVSLSSRRDMTDKTDRYEIETLARDISARKQADQALMAALDEKEILLREIHHRVKNNMQMISSMLALQAARVDNCHTREMLLESQHRIIAMAMIHEILYGGKSLASIDLADYLGRLVAHLQGIYNGNGGVRLVLELEKIDLGIDFIVPCGLVLNELLTNAFKHAFPGGNTGIIKIKSYLSGDNELVVVVGDNGVGLPAGLDLDNPSSLGLKLVKGFVQHQLGGKWDVRNDNGTAVYLRIPLSATSEVVV